jgi:hypothetical protein
MNLDFGNTGVNIQLIPIYGLSAGILYYDPNLEPDVESVEPEDYYHEITLMLLLFGLHITIWKY